MQVVARVLEVASATETRIGSKDKAAIREDERKLPARPEDCY